MAVDPAEWGAMPLAPERENGDSSLATLPAEPAVTSIGSVEVPAFLPPDSVVVAVGRRPRVPTELGPGRRFVRDVLRGGAILFLLHFFVIQISVVRGHSMQPSLQDGDRLVVDRVSYHLVDVARFDVVILRYPEDPSVDFVKRVIGLPGDRVEVRHGRLMVNGEEVPQQFGHVIDPAGMAEHVVPPGQYLVLGDNRPISCDSREFGYVPFGLLKGRVRVCFWPIGRIHLF